VVLFHGQSLYTFSKFPSPFYSTTVRYVNINLRDQETD
jgi:hypothetical protein